MILSPRSVAQIRGDWGWIKNGLQDVISRTHERWMPEDVYVALTSNNAALYALSDAGDDIGFTVLRKNTDFDGPTLFVWVLWAEPGSILGKQDALFEQLRAIAHQLGAKRITWESPRDGWRWVREAVPVRTVYEVEL